jgi:carboxylate-amine ligase
MRGEPLPNARPEVLRAAKWRAARYGLEAELVDVSEGRARPAAELIEKLLAHLRPALETDGNWEEIAALTRYTLARGNGATRQRQVFARTDNFEAVVDLIVAETAEGTN